MPRSKANELNEEARKNIKRGSKPWTEALHLELFSGDPDRKKLRKIAKNMINAAAEGDEKAIREIAERLDGKVSTSLSTEKPIEIVVNR